jgi:tetratricopeptide (TPR) repeat protein
MAEESPHRRLAPELLKEKAFEALTTLLLRLADERPVFAVFEDLHWADASTLDLLGFVLSRIGSARICLVLTARPEFRPSWPYQPWLNLFWLERLPPRQTVELVRQVATGRQLRDETVEQLAAKTDGVPLFVEEMTRMVVDQAAAGAMAGEPPSIPVTLSGLLLARLDRLPPRQKALAQLCSVVGRSFSHALLGTLSGRNATELASDLSGLLQSGLLQRVEDAAEPHYQFRHALIQDVAYQSLPRRMRREYHGCIACALAAQHPELVDTHPEMLAHHFTEAGEFESAIQAWSKAGERASLRSANVEAVSHLSRALQLLRSLPDASQRSGQELQLLALLGIPLMQTRSARSHEVEQTYNRVRELFHQVGDALPRLRISMWGPYAYYFMRAKFDVAQDLAKLTVDLGARQHCREWLALGHRMMATNFFTWGQMAAALEHVERALECSNFDLDQHRALAVKELVNPRVGALAYGAVVQSVVGHEEQARRYGQEAVALAEQIGHPHSLAFALTYVALGCQLRRDAEAAWEWTQRCIPLSAEHRFRLWLSWCVFIRSWVIAERGGLQEGLALLRGNLSKWRAAGIRAGLPLFLGMLAEIHLKLGNFQQGLKAVRRALGWADSQGERSYEVELHRLEGELLRALGHEEAAMESYLRALEVARQQGSDGFGCRVKESLERPAREWAKDPPPARPP